MSDFHGNQHTESAHDDYAYDDLVTGVRALGEHLGRSPTTRDAQDHDALPCLARLYDLTDDWNTVLADAGLEPTQVETTTPRNERQCSRIPVSFTGRSRAA